MLFIGVLLWSVVWKGLALWFAARNGHRWWFCIILVVNTLGILEIIYIFGVAHKKLPAFGGKKHDGGASSASV